jgi:DnaJ-domain-containing protein 1
MKENPVVRIQRRWLEVFIEEWQRWLNEVVADTFNPSIVTEFMKGLGVDPSRFSGISQQPGCFDAYRILGLDPSAGDDEIKKRYHDLVRRLHPDTSGTPATGFLFQMVVAAFETIKRERGWP